VYNVVKILSLADERHNNTTPLSMVTSLPNLKKIDMAF